MLSFPKREDIRLMRAPLTEVVCQVRFPPILRIVAEQPIDFQDMVRADFPDLEVQQGVLIQSAPLLSAPPTVQTQPSVFRFKSLDGCQVVSLASSFYALSTTAYSHWRDFATLLETIDRAARQVYRISSAQRIGLRYINQLTLDNTGAKSVADFCDIVRPELTVLLRQAVWQQPLETLHHLLLEAGENERLALRVHFQRGDQPALVLDFDYYVEGTTPLDQLLPLCNRYHDTIYNAFRWCVPDDKLIVFQPVPGGN